MDPGTPLPAILSRAKDRSFVGGVPPTPQGMTGEGTRPTTFLGSFARLRMTEKINSIRLIRLNPCNPWLKKRPNHTPFP